MATKQTLLPFKILTFLFLFTIGDSTAQNGIQVVIQNDASEYPTLLFNYFKKHKATFDSCGLHFAVKLEENPFICNGIGLSCTFSLEKDAFACILKNCRTNLIALPQHYDYNITTEKSDRFLLAKWDDDLLNLLFQIDTNLLTQVTDFKPLSVLLKSKDSLLTHDNLLENSELCDLLDAADIIALKYFAEKRGIHWKKLFAPAYGTLIIPFDNRCSFKPLKYLTNIKSIQLKDSWKSNLLKNDEILYLKESGVSITIIGTNKQDNIEIQQKLLDNGIKNIIIRY
jgi:hypothetical protein